MLVLAGSVASCHKNTTGKTGTGFHDKPSEAPLISSISEASGIADSKANPGYLWVEEDSGNPPQLQLLSHAGKTLKTVFIRGAANRDWEDMALAAGPDPAKRYLYIAETGDNASAYDSVAFYRLEEPVLRVDTVEVFDKINFVYEDGPRDAEAFLVDDPTKDIYIISKRDAQSRLYKLAWPYSSSSVNKASFVASLPYNGVVSAAISNNGKDIIVKTYQALYYYSKAPSETIAQCLQKPFVTLGYELEPQGEAITFAQDNSGFFTLSESGFAGQQSLFFYQRN